MAIFSSWLAQESRNPPAFHCSANSLTWCMIGSVKHYLVMPGASPAEPKSMPALMANMIASLVCSNSDLFTEE